MKIYKYLFVLLLVIKANAQDFDLPSLDTNILSPTIQSPLYQTFEFDEFYLLVDNVNIYEAPMPENSFDFLEASARKEEKQSYQQFLFAVERQMAQYSNFRVEVNNSKSSALLDYHDQPIYSGLNRVRNSAYQRADRLTGTPRRGNPFFLAPSLTARRGFFWY